jgi:hypothetical protein
VLRLTPFLKYGKFILLKTLLSFSLLCGLHATEEDTPVVSPLESAQKAQLEGRYDESVHLFQAVLEKDPENVLAKQGLKESERQQKQLHKKQMAQERKNIVLVENDLEERLLLWRAKVGIRSFS